MRQFLAEEYSGVERFLAELYRSLPGVPREEILWRFHFMMGATSYAIAGTDALQLFAGQFDDRDPARLMPRLMSFLLGGLRAALRTSASRRSSTVTRPESLYSNGDRRQEDRWRQEMETER